MPEISVNKSEMEKRWKTAPFWADFLAIDADGVVYWYAKRPSINPYLECWETWDASDECKNSGRMGADVTNWHECISERPNRVPFYVKVVRKIRWLILKLKK